MPRKKTEKGKAATDSDATLLPTSSAGPQHVTDEPTHDLEAQAPAGDHQSTKQGKTNDYPPEPNPRSWTHSNDTGAEFRTRRDPYQAEIVFKEKPSQKIIDYVKANGFEWNREEKFWKRPIGFKTQQQDRLIATRTYHRAVDMIREEKGLAPKREVAGAF